MLLESMYNFFRYFKFANAETEESFQFSVIIIKNLYRMATAKPDEIQVYHFVVQLWCFG